MRHEETISYKQIFMKLAPKELKERYKKLMKADKGIATYHNKYIKHKSNRTEEYEPTKSE